MNHEAVVMLLVAIGSGTISHVLTRILWCKR
jgi:hypothetical protein